MTDVLDRRARAAYQMHCTTSGTLASDVEYDDQAGRWHAVAQAAMSVDDDLSAFSTYARMVIERGPDIVRSQLERLVATIAEARNETYPGTDVHAALSVDTTMPDLASKAACARSLDAMTNAVVAAQRHVSHESPASAILFLDAEKRRRWTSYGDYVRDLDDYVQRALARI